MRRPRGPFHAVELPAGTLDPCLRSCGERSLLVPRRSGGTDKGVHSTERMKPN